jgi:hypothetical protein
MKNLYLLPTDQPSRLVKIKDTFFLTTTDDIPGGTFYNIHITNDEEIKEGVNQWYLDKFLNKPMNSGGAQYGEKQNIITLTTDQTLIADGVQSINDEFLKWFVKNPSCEFVEVKHKDIIQYGNMTMHDHNGDGSYYFCTNCEVETSRSKEELLKFGVEYYKIIIPKEELTYTESAKKEERIFNSTMMSKQETIEEVSIKISEQFDNQRFKSGVYFGVKEGAKWQAERSILIDKLLGNEDDSLDNFLLNSSEHTQEERELIMEAILVWFEQFKKK